MRHVVGVLHILSLAGCGEPVNRAATVLTMGDSLLAWNRAQGGSVSDYVERMSGMTVEDRSVPAARVMFGLPGLYIPTQFAEGDWKWVILNGGGNDLWLGCGCLLCRGSLNRMVSADGATGKIPTTVKKIREIGAQVIYVGYLRSPGRGSPIEHCRDEGDILETRLTHMAARDPGVHFLSIADLVPDGDASFHALDRIHPSEKASKSIAARIVAIMRR